MATLSVKKVLALPSSSFEPNGLYITNEASGQCSLYVANSSGTALRPFISVPQKALIDMVSNEAAQAMATANSAALAASSTWSGFRNRIMNPSGFVDQVNLSVPVNDSAGIGPFCCDRWRLGTATGATIRAGRGTTGARPTPNWIYAQVISAKASPAAADQFRILQSIEGHNIVDLNSGYSDSATVTITFKTRHTIAGKYSLALYNGAANRSYVATYTQNVADTTEEKSITVKLDTTGTWNVANDLGIGVSFDYGSGANFQTSNTGVWQAGIFFRTPDSVYMVSQTNAVCRITDVQFAIAGTSPLLEFRPVSIELELCQRYFERMNPNDVRVHNILSYDRNTPFNSNWKVPKRIAPTVTLGAGILEYATTNSFSGYALNLAQGTWFTTGTVLAFADF